MEENVHVEEIIIDTPAQPEQSEPPKQKKDRFLPISILIAAFVLAGAIVFAAVYHPSQSGTPTQAGPSMTIADIMKLGPRDAILGNQNAPVTFIEYGDYQCPFCGLFFTQTEQQLIQNYVSTGKVRMVFRNFPFLGAESTAAAEAAECAQDQNKAWAYHDALYAAKVADATKGGSENDGYFTNAVFISLAQKANLDVAAFTSCINNNAESAAVTKDVQNANAAGVDSTPTFFINGTQVLGAQPYTTFQQIIDSALAKQ